MSAIGGNDEMVTSRLKALTDKLEEMDANLLRVKREYKEFLELNRTVCSYIQASIRSVSYDEDNPDTRNAGSQLR